MTKQWWTYNVFHDEWENVFDDLDELAMMNHEQFNSFWTRLHDFSMISV